MNILLTSVGRRSYLVDFFKEALGKEGEVHVSNSSSINPSFRCADHCVVTPLIYSDAYIPFLLEYCRKNHIDALLSLLDMDLPILAAHREQFEATGTRLIVSDAKAIAICNDKWLAFKFLKENGFDAPKTWLSPEGAVKNKTSFPLFCKPRWGMGSLSIFEADDERELEILFQKASRLTLASSMLKYEAGQDMDNCVIVQEKLNGQEYGLDVINDLEGNYQATIVKKKLAMRAGETDSAQVVTEPILTELGKKLSAALGHIGNLDVDAFLVDGKPYVLEMNARFGGGYPFSHLAGVDLPKAIVKWLAGKKAEADLFKARVGVIGQKDMLIREIKPISQKMGGLLGLNELSCAFMPSTHTEGRWAA